MKSNIKAKTSKSKAVESAEQKPNERLYWGSIGGIIGGICGVAVMLLVILVNYICASNGRVEWNGVRIVTPEQAQEWHKEKNYILYESSDSETGAVTVYYRDSAWATFTDNRLYLLQQYLAPKNKHGSLYDEVCDLPEFKKHGASAVYYAVNNDNGEFTELNKDVVYDAISAGLGTTNFTVFVEWDTNDGNDLGYANLEIGADDPNMTDDHWFYQYQYKYADVSTLCTYTDSAGLFRTYVEYLQSNDLVSQSTDNTGTEQEFSVDPSLYSSLVEGSESGTETTPAVTGIESESDETEASGGAIINEVAETSLETNVEESQNDNTEG